jgi:hypothetical protein
MEIDQIDDGQQKPTLEPGEMKSLLPIFGHAAKIVLIPLRLWKRRKHVSFDQTNF